MEKHLPNLTNSIITYKNNKLTHIITLMLSNHLYISFIILFSPYLLKLFTYLFPLFITTSLLLLSLFTAVVPLDSIINSEDGFFIASYTSLLEILHHKDEDKDGRMEPIQVFEAYKIVFETPLNEFEETQVEFYHEKVEYESNVNVKEKKYELHLGDNVSKEEKMDLLWETYETEEVKEEKNQEKIKELMVINDNHKVNYGDNDQESNESGNLCCLKALKLSAGKMNLSMGKSRLVKFGKVFKGIGWLQKHGRIKKHTKKG